MITCFIGLTVGCWIIMLLRSYDLLYRFVTPFPAPPVRRTVRNTANDTNHPPRSDDASPNTVIISCVRYTGMTLRIPPAAAIITASLACFLIPVLQLLGMINVFCLRHLNAPYLAVPVGIFLLFALTAVGGILYIPYARTKTRPLLYLFILGAAIAAYIAPQIIRVDGVVFLLCLIIPLLYPLIIAGFPKPGRATRLLQLIAVFTPVYGILTLILSIQLGPVWFSLIYGLVALQLILGIAFILIGIRQHRTETNPC